MLKLLLDRAKKQLSHETVRKSSTWCDKFFWIKYYTDFVKSFEWEFHIKLAKIFFNRVFEKRYQVLLLLNRSSLSQSLCNDPMKYLISILNMNKIYADVKVQVNRGRNCWDSTRHQYRALLLLAIISLHHFSVLIKF